MQSDKLILGLAQIAPVWLDKVATLEKVIQTVKVASQKKCQLVVFGEALIPGYPFWIEHTEGAKFDSDLQKELFAHYSSQAIRPEKGDLEELCRVVQECGCHLIVGTIEAAENRGGHSMYCSLIYIDSSGQIANVHRKIMPTFEERLVWAQGDGFGLKTFKVGSFTMGALNCWENWMPLARTALYGQGEDLHIALWPGTVRNTVDLTRNIAKESRSYVVSVCSVMTRNQIPDHIPFSDLLRDKLPEVMADGGSCVSDPTGNWVQEPIPSREGLTVVEIDHRQVRKERQNFDPVGHYSRPDILKLVVNRDRQQSVTFEK